MAEVPQHYRIFETARGCCGIAWSDLGITAFQLPAKSAEAAERLMLRRVPAARPGMPPPAVAEAIADAEAYFEGKAIDFSRFPLDLGPQNPLFERIYAAARQLRWGETTTYGAIAKALGAGPEVAREVGQAMARNPVPLIIPCHRVLAAGGRIGGFSAPGGTETKAHMLALEGVRPAAAPEPAQQAFSF